MFDNLAEMTEFLFGAPNLTIIELRLSRDGEAQYRTVREDRAWNTIVLRIETLSTEDNSHIASRFQGVFHRVQQPLNGRSTAINLYVRFLTGECTLV